MASTAMGSVCVGQAGRAVSAASVMMNVKFQTATVMATVLTVTAAVLRAIRVNFVRKMTVLTQRALAMGGAYQGCVFVSVVGVVWIATAGMMQPSSACQIAITMAILT
ncbi:hypothetical protein E2C01_007794 [Portunus trituberculatus]|uniref:Uncharacterized protein n=1 Tax=Portunus trituberculatus TaxID=210409 RepID=A0A5B7D4T6_PORTR|nr:hypothetical protein [Portunus trituberculatus]